VGPLRRAGAGAQARRVAEWLSAYSGPIDYQIRDLDVTTDGQVAFCATTCTGSAAP
jgi:ketosteroid isomerase-like protein